MTEGRRRVQGEGDDCPDCGGPTRVVTAVTITTLPVDPRRVLVTRQCNGPTCQLKFPVVKPEPELTDEEISRWRRK